MAVMNRHLHTTRAATSRALVHQGVRSVDCYAQLKAWLSGKKDFFAKRGLSMEVVFFLSEPVQDASGDIDWYCESETEAVPLDRLEPSDKKRCLQRLDSLRQACLELTQTERSRDPMAAGLLMTALTQTAPDDVYACQGWPVLVNWGLAPHDEKADVEDIKRMGGMNATAEPAADIENIVRQTTTPPKPKSPPATTPENTPATPQTPPPGCPGSIGRTGCLSWILPVLLLSLLFWLTAPLIPGLGPLPIPLPGACSPGTITPAQDTDNPALSAETDRLHELARQRAELEQALAERAALCRPVVETKPAPTYPLVPDEPEEAAPERLSPEEMPFFGILDTDETAPDVDAPMEIPDTAAKEMDLGFLKGCWRSRSGLYNSRTNRPVEAEYCFDANGSGQRFVYEENGVVCKGPVKARFSGSRLDITASRAPCTENSYYETQTVVCTGSGSSTTCVGTERGGSTWSTRFSRR